VEYIVLILNPILDVLYINVLDFYVYNFLEDIFIICIIYNFLKMLTLGVLSELIWPTQFFNRRNFIGAATIKKRTYVEFLLKLNGFKNLFKSLKYSINI